VPFVSGRCERLKNKKGAHGMSNEDPQSSAGLTIAAKAALSAPPDESRPSIPAEVRALGIILALDLLVGVWLALHSRGSIAGYLAPQLPVIGLGAVCWGFLPDAPKKAFGRWLAHVLAAPPVHWLVITCVAIGVAMSLFVSTVIIESVDPSVSTTVRLFRGNPADADRKAVGAAGGLRLNRLTTPLREHLAITPFGQPVWAHTPTHVSVANPRVVPWIPTVLQYPDDFVPLVVIEVLPTDSALATLSPGDIKLLVRFADGEHGTIAEGVLAEGSTRISFTQPSPIGSETLERWRASLRKIDPSPKYVEPMLRTWQNTQTLLATYPIRVRDRLRYEVQSASGKTLRTDELVLTDAVTRLDLSF
jgi:hypothetical protein